MRFALLGDHPDGVDFAAAAVASGRHQLVACCGVGDAVRQRLGDPRAVSDAEEILADPAVEAVVVAGPPGVRGEQLRRAVQSERAVACVHPAGDRPDLAYEVSMTQADTGHALMPLLPEATHPAFRRLAEFVGQNGALRLLLVERA